jgi:hypothetical protein
LLAIDNQSSIPHQRTDRNVAVLSNQVRTRHISFAGDDPEATYIVRLI